MLGPRVMVKSETERTERRTAQPGTATSLIGRGRQGSQGGRRVQILSSRDREEHQTLTKQEDGIDWTTPTFYLDEDKYQGKDLELPIPVSGPKVGKGLVVSVRRVNNEEKFQPYHASVSYVPNYFTHS